MEKGTSLQHKFIKSLKATLLDQTSKGYKLSVVDTSKRKAKSKIQFFDKIDFDKEKGIWDIEN